MARRHSVSIVICAAMLAAFPGVGLNHPTAAKDGLTGPVTMTVGFGAGERPDLYARVLGRSLVRFLPGNPGLLVLNKPGAGGVIALNEWVSKAEPNGLHVTVGGSSQIDMDALARTRAKSAPPCALAIIRRSGGRHSWAGTFSGYKAIGSPASFGRPSNGVRSTWGHSVPAPTSTTCSRPASLLSQASLVP